MYFVEKVSQTYASSDVCKILKIVPEVFPYAEVFGIEPPDRCGILPTHPTELPFPSTEDNIDNLQYWLLEAFADTTFNIKGHLPEMAGKPHELHLKEDATPYAANSPIHVSHY